MKTTKTLFIAGGGTGGHIYPGLAIAKALKEKSSLYQIHFVGTPAGLEKSIVPKEGFPLHLITVGKLNHSGGIAAKLRTLIALPLAFLSSFRIILKYRPQFVLGVGGYASGPFVLAASLCRIPAAIWEPNAIPGLTNRWLSHFVREAFVVFPEADSHLKSLRIRRLGLPVRKGIETVGSLPAKTTSDEFHVLVFGGSQGARAINNAISKIFLNTQGEWHKDPHFAKIKFIHQTGRLDYADIIKGYECLSPQLRKQIDCREYIFDMETCYQWADLIICRSGASTVAEVAACAKPALFIPLPTAADDHQTKNALSLVNQKAGMILYQKDLSPHILIAKIMELMENRELREEIRIHLGQFYQPKAAEHIAEAIIESL